MTDYPSIGGLPSGARALVVTVSDGVSSGTRQDESGVALSDRLAHAGFRVDRVAVPDERPRIEQALRDGAAEHQLIISTGGTGLTPRDVTPQATQSVVDYEVPGLAEAMRAAGRAKTPMADLSRGVVGVIGRSLVVNVPGSPRAAIESLVALEPTLGHALETLAGPFDHGLAGATHDVGSDLAEPSPAATSDTAPASSFFDDAPAGEPFVPRTDDNDEWRDLPERKGS